MEREMITIPKGGRPCKEYSAAFFATLEFQRTTMTVKEIAEFYNVSMSTANRWLRKARELNAETKTKSDK